MSSDATNQRRLRHRLRYLFATPWLRAAFAIGSILWLICLTAAIAMRPDLNHVLGPLSVIPVFASWWMS